MKKLIVALLAVWNTGCASLDTPVTPNYDAKFGDAVREAKLKMTINPNAGREADQTSGIDGAAGKHAIDRYKETFKEPPPVVPVINIGGTFASGGGK